MCTPRRQLSIACTDLTSVQGALVCKASAKDPASRRGRKTTNLNCFTLLELVGISSTGKLFEANLALVPSKTRSMIKKTHRVFLPVLFWCKRRCNGLQGQNSSGLSIMSLGRCEHEPWLFGNVSIGQATSERGHFEETQTCFQKWRFEAERGNKYMGKTGTIWQFFRALFPGTWRTLPPDALFTRIRGTRQHPESAAFSCFPC